MAKNPRFVKTLVQFSKGKSISIYAGTHIGAALKELSELDAFAGVKILQLVEAAYKQGVKDGRHEVIKKIDNLTGSIDHQNPGRPRKN